MKLQIICIIGLLICAVGCSTTSEQKKTLRIASAAATIEVIGENPSNAAVMSELSDALSVFCGTQEVDSLALWELIKGRLSGINDDRSRARIAIFILLLEEFGANINPSDFVTWGKFACEIRGGIQRGLTLANP